MKKYIPYLMALVVTCAMTIPLQAQDNENWAMLEQFCTTCHNAEDWAGSVAFDLMSPDALHTDAEIWEESIRKLRGRLMPPPGNDQPEQETIDLFVSWLEGQLDAAASNGPVAGHVPVQRLNRTEYEVAIKDLLGVEIEAEEFLPLDIEVDGFNNIAAALSVSPAFLEQYINAARAVASMAVGNASPKMANAYYPPEGVTDQDTYQHGMPLGTRGGMKIQHNFPADGEYRINILDLDVGLYPRAIETRQTLVMLIGGEEVFREYIGGPEDFEMINKGGAPAVAKLMERFSNIPVQVKAGLHEVIVTFIERARVETDEFIGGFTPYGGFSFTGALRVPRLIDGIQIIGPYNAAGISMTPTREKIFVCEPERPSEETACARNIIENLSSRAYRREVSNADVDRLMPFFESGRQQGGFDLGIEQAVTAILASPDFLYRAISPMKDIGDAEVFALSDQELATRLSFFLWSQGPDDELILLANQGLLKDAEVLEQQVERMLADKRAASLVDSFAFKWLNLDELDVIEPDPALFPGFSDQLYDYFSEELRLFLGSILLEDQSVTEILNAKHTFLNEPLARHYGIDSVFGGQFRRVELADERRWGILGKGAALLRTSYGDRTSPVLRGSWVLEKLMGTPPAPPPPNVETDLSVPEGELPTTVRSRLERHREQPSCNQCHGVIDPIGLALENYTVTGQWRDVDLAAKAPIDASTTLPNGVSINGPIELREQLASRPQQFALAITEKLMMYALGRELEYFDMPQVRAIVSNAEENDYRFSSIVKGIVSSDAFLNQSLPHDASGTVAMQSE